MALDSKTNEILDNAARDLSASDERGGKLITLAARSRAMADLFKAKCEYEIAQIFADASRCYQEKFKKHISSLNDPDGTVLLALTARAKQAAEVFCQRNDLDVAHVYGEASRSYQKRFYVQIKEPAPAH